MKNIKVSEMFYSIQGEGRYVGAPSVFLRTFGCNLACEGFGMSPGEKSQQRNEVVLTDNIKTLHDLPLVSTGCDSYGSWDVRFKHLSPKIQTNKLADDLLALIPGGTEDRLWDSNVHLIITGGEPLLGWQKAYIELLGMPCFSTLKHLTFETNGTKILTKEFQQYLYDKDIEVTFSVSTKLSASGEDRAIAVIPEAVSSYASIGDVVFKFVCDNEDQLAEVKDVVRTYKTFDPLNLIDAPVYIMPAGGMVKEYKENSLKIAELCLKHKFNYSPRLHVDLFGNAWAT